SVAARRHLELHLRRRVHQGLPQARRPCWGHPALQARLGGQVGQGLRHAVARPMSSDRNRYTEFRPRWYRPRMSTWWWLKRWSSVAFILRELSSIFIAWFIYFFLRLVHALGRSDLAYQGFLDWAASPGIVILNGIALVFVLFHAVTWFNLAPQAMVVHLRRTRLP